MRFHPTNHAHMFHCPRRSEAKGWLGQLRPTKCLWLSMLTGAALGLGANYANAGPVSSCTAIVNGSTSCTLFETDANGKSSESGFLLTLSAIVFTPGFEIITEAKNNNVDTDPNHWSDLVYFTNKSVQFISDPENEATFTFPITTADGKTFTAAQVVAMALGYVGEANSPQKFTITNFSGTGKNSFAANSDAIPEPASLGLLASALCGLFYGIGRRRAQ